MIQIDIKDDDTIYMTGTVGYVADMSVAESFFS
jgi:diaminopimelate epimerase